ncbi:MAG TPA: beta-ketoacyl synthase N-terminal-like domain-containing protein, partial [Candidatus Saccharimonadales bacterium]|nr:beta-ketoacyl synthase N-terminal-like domain-containing protein [Candidatus Saccharimonadales bacterium]
DLKSSWQKQIEGFSGLENSDLPEHGTEVKVFGKVKANHLELLEKIKGYGFNGEILQDFRRQIVHRSVQMGMVAMAEATSGIKITDEEGKLNKKLDPNRIGIFTGDVLAGAADIGADEKTVLERGRADARSIRKVDPATMATVPSRYLKTHGPALNIVTACSSGTDAIHAAAQSVRDGRIKIGIVIGADAFIMRPIMTKYFEALIASAETKVGALSKESDPLKALRAYDKNPTGTVIGEGAGAIIIGTEEMLQLLQLKSKALLAGWGSAADGDHPTNPNGKGTELSLHEALIMARVLRGPGYMNGHGGGTGGDAYELKALYDTFWQYKLHKLAAINSTKASTGHMWGAAGSWESIVAIMALNEGIIPPMLNSVTPLVDFIEFARNEALVRELEWTGSTNTGLGGQTATVLYKRAA